MAESERTVTKEQQEVVDAIRKLDAAGEPLNVTAVKRRHPKLLQAAYAMQPFWGWRRALEAAGLDRSEIRVELAEFIECRICGRSLRMLPLHLKGAHGTDGPTYFDEYPDAELVSEKTRARIALRKLDEARTIVPHWEPIWSPEYALDRLSLLAEQGVALSREAVFQSEASLVFAVEKYFGNWKEGLRRVGLDPDEICGLSPAELWTEQDVLKEILRKRQAGERLDYAAIRWEPPGFFASTRARFGSYPKALSAAGIELATGAQRAPCTAVDATPGSMARARRARLKARMGASQKRRRTHGWSASCEARRTGAQASWASSQAASSAARRASAMMGITAGSEVVKRDQAQSRARSAATSRTATRSPGPARGRRRRSARTEIRRN